MFMELIMYESYFRYVPCFKAAESTRVYSLPTRSLYVACEIKAAPTSVPMLLKKSFYIDVLCPAISRLPTDSMTRKDNAVETIMSTK